MGEADVQAQLTRIDQTRADLDRTIDELFAVIPPKDELVAQAKQLAAVGGAAVVAILVGTSVLTSRRAESSRRKQARVNAEELVRAFRNMEEGNEMEDRSSVKAWFAVGAGVAAVGVAVYNRVGRGGGQDGAPQAMRSAAPSGNVRHGNVRHGNVRHDEPND